MVKRKRALLISGAIITLCVFIALYLFYPNTVDIELVETLSYDPDATILPPCRPEWWEQVGRSYEGKEYNNAFDLFNKNFGLSEKLNRIKAENDKKYGTDGRVIISWGYPLERLWYRRVRVNNRGIHFWFAKPCYYIVDALFKKGERQDRIFVYYTKSDMKLTNRFGSDLDSTVMFAS